MLNLHESPEEIKSRVVELGSESWTFLLPLLLNGSATDIVPVTLLRTAVETATGWYTSCYAMAGGGGWGVEWGGGGGAPP